MESGAAGIVKATEEIFQAFCTPWHGVPTDVRGKNKPVMDKGLYNHIRESQPYPLTIRVM